MLPSAQSNRNVGECPHEGRVSVPKIFLRAEAEFIMISDGFGQHVEIECLSKAHILMWKNENDH